MGRLAYLPAVRNRLLGVILVKVLDAGPAFVLALVDDRAVTADVFAAVVEFAAEKVGLQVPTVGVGYVGKRQQPIPFQVMRMMGVMVEQYLVEKLYWVLVVARNNQKLLKKSARLL